MNKHIPIKEVEIFDHERDLSELTDAIDTVMRLASTMCDNMPECDMAQESASALESVTSYISNAESCASDIEANITGELMELEEGDVIYSRNQNDAGERTIYVVTDAPCLDEYTDSYDYTDFEAPEITMRNIKSKEEISVEVTESRMWVANYYRLPAAIVKEYSEIFDVLNLMMVHEFGKLAEVTCARASA